MGVYGTSTFYQGEPSTPPPHPVPSSSQCTSVSTLGGTVLTTSTSGSSGAYTFLVPPARVVNYRLPGSPTGTTTPKPTGTVCRLPSSFISHLIADFSGHRNTEQ